MSNTGSRPRIGIVVDNPFRDLPGMVLLARELARRGADCFLIPWNRASSDIWPLAPDLLVMNYLRTNNEEFTRQLYRAGIRVVILDTEGSVFSPVPKNVNEVGADSEEDTLPAMEEYALTMARDKSVRHQVDRYCSWNKYFTEYAAEAGWYRADQITITGTPRVDFYAERWRKAARLMTPHTDQYDDPVILINGSFPLVNPAFQTPEREIQMMVRNFGYSQEYMESWSNAQARGLKGVTRLANELARRFPNVTFIFRPHPFEGRHVYRLTLDDDLPNLHFVKEGTVDSWILKAKAMIHWGSSTAIEGAIAGIPVLTAAWVPQNLPVPLVDDLNIECANPDEVAAHVEQIIKGEFELPAAIRAATENVVERTYSRIDGEAFLRAADVVTEVLEKKDGAQLSAAQCRRYSYGLFEGGSLKYRLTVGLKMVMGRSVHWSLRRLRVEEPGALPWDNSDKKFTPVDVQKIVDAIETTAGEDGFKARASEAGELNYGYRAARCVKVSG